MSEEKKSESVGFEEARQRERKGLEEVSLTLHEAPWTSPVPLCSSKSAETAAGSMCSAAARVWFLHQSHLAPFSQKTTSICEINGSSRGPCFFTRRQEARGKKEERKEGE